MARAPRGPGHLYSQTTDMDPIVDFANRRGFEVVEDGCQAHGAFYRGRPAGPLGAATAFSWYPTKNLGACGERSMVTTHRREVADRIRRVRDHGQSEKYRGVEEGCNSRLDTPHAAILRMKLKRLAAWNERRRALAARYGAGLRHVGEAPGGGAVGRPVTAQGVALSHEMPWGRRVFHLYAIRAGGRDQVRQALMERGIHTGLQYALLLLLQPAYAWMGLKEGSFLRPEALAREGITLPFYPGMADEQVDRVCEALRGVPGGLGDRGR